jgi:phage-related protein
VTVIGEAFIEVRPDSRGFGPETEKSVLGSVTSIAKKAATIIGTVFVADQARQFFTGAITGASDLSESMSKNTIVFGDAADSVRRFTENAAKGLGQSQAQALEATGVFGNLFRALEIGEAPAAEMSTTLVQLASDLASFNNASPEEALDALRAGIVGETEPLKRFGVNLNEATIKAKALELGIGSATGTLTAAEKAQAAYALILEQTTLAQGDFARTSGGLANQQRILSAQWQDMQAKVGTLLLPAITKLAVFANETLLPGIEALARSVGDVLGPAFQGLADIWRELGQGNLAGSLAVEIGKLLGLAEDAPLVDGLATAFENVAGAIATTMGSVADVVAPAVAAVRDQLGGAVATAREAWGDYAERGVGPVADALDRIVEVAGDVNRVLAEQRDILIPAAAAAAGFAAAFATYTQVSRGITAVTVAAQLLGPALSGALAPLLANPVGLIIAGIVAAGAAFYAAYRNIEPFREAVDAVARVIRDVALAAFDQLVALAERIGPSLSGAVDAVGGALSGIAEVASDVAGSVIEALQPIVDWIDDNLLATFLAAADFIDALFDRLVAIARPFVQVYVAGLKLVAGVVKDVLEAAFRVAAPLIIGYVRQIGNVLETLARVAIPVLLTAFDAVRTVVQVVFNTITGIIEGALSVIRGLFEVAAGILRGDFSRIWEGLQDIVLGPITAVKDIVFGNLELIFGFFSAMPERIGAVFRALWDGVQAIAATAVETLTSTVSGAVEGIVGFFSGLPGRLLAFVGTVGEAALSIGQAIIGKLFEGLGGLADKAGELAGGVLRAVQDLGKSIINGVIDAINDMLPNNVGRVVIDTPVGSQTIFPGIDLPNNPIPRLAAGALIRRRPGGIFANIGEGATDEAVVPLPAGLLAGLQAIARGTTVPGRAGAVVEAGAIQIVAPDTPAALIAAEAVDRLGWALTTRSDR